MCDVCNAKGKDYIFANGKNAKLGSGKLYRALDGHIIEIKICRLHSIELFMIGEARFLTNHPDLVRLLKEKKSTSSVPSPF